MNFDDITYLQRGGNRQRQAYDTLTKNHILSTLKRFEPILVGTIPINIDIENSDLDIICCFADSQEFTDAIIAGFGTTKGFMIKELTNLESNTVLANFFVDGFEIEIFGQNIPTQQQLAYRHLVVEHHLLNKYGEGFRKQIVELKRQGHKTEPAFGLALGLEGDPYVELLQFEKEDWKTNR